MLQENQIIRCYHCGNLVNCKLVFADSSALLFEQFLNPDQTIDKFYRKFDFLNYKCSTCGGINLIGGFCDNDDEAFEDRENYKRLYPEGPSIVPPKHHWGDNTSPIPSKLVRTYEEIWHLKHQAPNAFGNQIRRCLEFICMDKQAEGANLYKQLVNLYDKGWLPGNYKGISNIIRSVGNMGSHLSERELDYWDVELLDEFFRMIVNYIYVIPSKLARLEQRVNPDPKSKT